MKNIYRRLNIDEMAADFKEIRSFVLAKSSQFLDHCIESVLLADTQDVHHWYGELWAIFWDCIRRQVAKRGNHKVHYPNEEELNEWLVKSCYSDLEELSSIVLADSTLYKPNAIDKEYEAIYEVGYAYDSDHIANAINDFYIAIIDFAQSKDRANRDKFLEICEDILTPAGQYEIEGRHSEGRP